MTNSHDSIFRKTKYFFDYFYLSFLPFFIENVIVFSCNFSRVALQLVFCNKALAINK